MKNIYIVGSLQTEANASFLHGGIMAMSAKVSLKDIAPGSIGVCLVFGSKKAAKKFAGTKYEIWEGKA